MTKTKKAIVLIIAFTALMILGYPQRAHEASTTTFQPEQIESPEVETPVVIKNKLSVEAEKWIDDLEMCESSGNPNALNPVDLDGTPSHGAFQFKDTTFYSFAALYGIEGDLYDRDAQRAIVEYWVEHPGEIRWTQQFPACVRKLGHPPMPAA